jgi:glycosyltransferase involved in cell wall biosynthesis
MLSVVIPAYNEEAVIERAADTITRVLGEAGIGYELLFIDDGSKDGTYDRIREISSVHPDIRGIRFSRNFGKEAAMFAGLQEAEGDCVIVMDCDLQHPPEKIPEMYRLWEEGYEIVEGVKHSRGHESGAHALAAKSFYRILSDAIGIDMSRASDFKLLDRKAVTVLLNMPEKQAFFRALSSWIGFKTIQIEYDVRDRSEGSSKWSTGALIRYAFSNITSYTTLPLQLITVLGILVFVVSVVMAVIALVQKFNGTALGGFTTVIILQCFTSSMIMLSIGIIGYYLAKIYEEVKGRPRYIISEKTGKK